MDGLRRTLHDDPVAQLGNADPVQRGDATLRWIQEMTANVV
jgi:hypothetical protein